VQSFNVIQDVSYEMFSRIRGSAWQNCTENVQRDGCTFHDILAEVLGYPHWSQFNSYDINQQRYTEAIDSVDHLCSNIVPSMNN